MSKYAGIAKQGSRQTDWRQASPLGNLIGVTVSAELLQSYNRQFSSTFAKSGLVGSLPRAKRGTSICILLKKSTKEAKVTVQKA